MKLNLLHRRRYFQYMFFLGIVFQMPIILKAQSLKISDFVLFGGTGFTTGTSCLIQKSGVSVKGGGNVGSYSSITTGNNFSNTGNVYSGGTMLLGQGNVIGGNLAATNSSNISGTILSVGSSANISGNIDAKGNITVSGGTVTGQVTHPTGTTYTGPKPGGGDSIKAPNLPTLPALPAITAFPAAGTTNISSTTQISHGAYGNLSLGNNKTITFSDTGTYIFQSIKNSGNNSFVFDFKNRATGNIKIYVYGDIDVDKVNSSIINGGDASRIYTEMHGTGSTCTNGNYSFNVNNGSSKNSQSKWLGTVWAPYGAINIGSGSGNCSYTGALYSAKNVNIQNNVTFYYLPFIQCSTPVAKAGTDKVLDCNTSTVQLDGTQSTQGLQYSWIAINNGHIVSGATTLTPVVDAVGSYILTVTDPNGGCTSSDTTMVTFNRCIVPYYPPPPGGKIKNLIGAELNSLALNFGFVSDSAQNIFILLHDSVMIEVIALQGQYTSLLALLQTAPYGMTNLINNGPNTLIISGKYPIANLLKLNSLTTLIDYCRPVFPSVVNAGIVTSQGDAAVQADLVRGGYDLSGAGVKVGVISNSYNTISGNPAQTDVVNGDLPGIGNSDYPTPVEILGEYPFGTLSDEGRAMLQIVHDVAPGAKLAFRTGFINAGDFAQGITQLQQDGCNVIVDDVTYITEPFYQDGVVAQAVNSAAANGVAYFSAAGNFGSQSYENVFNSVAAPNGITGTAHNFSGTGNIYQTITLTPGTYTLVLQWQDGIYSTGQTQTGTQNDLDIYLTDNNGNALFGFNRDNTGGDPIEVLPFTVTQTTQTNIIIVRASGTSAVRFKYVFFRGNGVVSKYNSGTSTIVGQANADGAMAVGAVLYSNTPAYGVNPPTIASFSSTGGTLTNGVVRNKPEFCAPNGVNTTVFMNGQNIDNDAFPNFFGTSAAAPHAAGVAALLIEGKKKYANQVVSPDTLRALLERTAIDMGTPGFDYNTGYGFIQTNVAMHTFATPKPVITKLVAADNTITPGTQPITITVQGNFLDPNSKVLFRGNPVTTNPINATQANASIPAFIGNPAIQVYTAPISLSGTDGGYSDPLFFFSPVKKVITITAANQTKKYGEKIPSFSSTVLVDSVPLANTTLTLKDLGLDTINYTTTATNLSNAGLYNIKPVMKTFSPGDPNLIALNEIYKYVFTPGVLTVTSMPLAITPRDTVLTYGQQIHGINFNYAVTPTASGALPNPDSLINTIHLSHASAIVDTVYALVNGSGATGRALVNSDIINLGIMMSNGSGATGRALVNSGSGTTQTSYVVDVDVNSIFNYEANPASSPLVNGSGATGRALVNTGPLINGTASVTNGSGATGRALVNGDPSLVNSISGPDSSKTNVAVIVSAADVPSTTGNVILTRPINMVTNGITKGVHAIIPAAFVSANYGVTYGLGNLTIKQAPLTITANTIYADNGVIPPYTSTISGFQYQDSTIPRTGPTYTLSPTCTGKPGTYTIIPSGLSFAGDSNYTKTYVNGTLYINPYNTCKNIVIALTCIEKLKSPVSGCYYVAHFTAQNSNSTPYFVPWGTSNYLKSSGGIFFGVPPVLFLTGTTKFSVYFDGKSLTWTLKTYNGKTLTTLTAVASSSSRVCTASDLSVNAVDTRITNDIVNKAEAFPNPATKTLTITSYIDFTTEKNVTVFDIYGKVVAAPATLKSAQQIQINVASLAKGTYFVRIIQGDKNKIISFIKL